MTVSNSSIVRRDNLTTVGWLPLATSDLAGALELHRQQRRYIGMAFVRTDELAWRDLAEAARNPEGRAGDLLRLVKATAGRVIPVASRQDQAAFAALQSLARAYALAKADRRKRLRQCLSGLAQECSAAAAWTVKDGPSPSEERQSWQPRDLFDFAPTLDH